MAPTNAVRSVAAPAPLTGVTVVVAGAEHDAAVEAAAWWCELLGADVVAAGASTADRTGPVVRLVAGDGGGASPPGPVVSVDGPPVGEGGDEVWPSMALWARSGLAWLTRAVGGTADAGLPQVPVVPASEGIVGSLVAFAVAAAAVGIDLGNAVGNVAVDKLEALALLPMQPIAAAQLRREGFRVPDDLGLFEATDGTVYIRAVEPAQWQRLFAIVGGLDDLSAAVATDVIEVLRQWPRVSAALAEWASGQRAQDVVDRAQAERVPVSLVADPARMDQDPQLSARGFLSRDQIVRPPWLEDRAVAPVVPVAPVATAPAPTERRTADRRLRDQHPLPLGGVRVLDLTWAWAGPFATMLMADLGAEVVNVEWEPRPSNLRVQSPLVDNDAVDGGAWWSANQRNKLSIGIDLKQPEGRQIVLDLAAMSDIAIDNFSAGVVDRLGIGYEDLAAVNPALVYVSMSAYGAAGPCAHYLGYGTQLYTASGFANLTGRKPDVPSLMGIPLPDPISGVAGAVAAVSTLHRALTTGRGGHLDVSELEATCMTLRDGLTGRRSSYELGRDGEQVVVRQGTAEERVASLEDVLTDPWLRQRGFWHEDPQLAPRSPGLRMGGPPFLVDGERPPIWCGAPPLFSGTERVLQGLLGWDEGRVVAATSAGFVRCSP